MSFPDAAAFTPAARLRKVIFGPGGADTARMFALMLAGDAEQPRTAARKAVIAASNAVPSKPVYALAPLTFFFQYAANALPAGPPAPVPAEPLRPLTGSPILSSVSALRRASIASVLLALHFPLRTRDG